MSKAGEVEINFPRIGGKVFLSPTPFALRQVLTELGGARTVYVNLYNMDYKTIYTLIKAGTTRDGDVWNSDDEKALEQNIYEHGFSDLVEPCTRYLSILINGGREPKPEDENSGKD